MNARRADAAARVKSSGVLKKAVEDIERGVSPLEAMAKVADVQKAIRLENFVDTFKPYTFERLVDECEKTPPALELDIMRWGPVLSNNVKIQNGSLVAVAGRPRHGKTTLLLNLLTSLCAKYTEKTFVFISYEEQPRDIAIKIISILAGAPRRDLKGKLNIEEALRTGANIDAIKSGVEKFKSYTESGRLLFDCRVIGITELCNHIKFFKSRYDLGAVFVDYIQKIKSDAGVNSFSRQTEIQNISGQLLETARECDIPIIVGAQLNREAEKKSTPEEKNLPAPEKYLKKMQLGHLRESGDLEQDANIALFVYNPSAEGEKSDRIYVGIKKNRNGVSELIDGLEWRPSEFYLKGDVFIADKKL